MSAYFSPCRTWRYSLTRDVAPLTGEGRVTFIGLNPSTADETEDDPTIRRCIGFARRWGFAELKMLNIYGYRATDPNVMFEADDPVGPDNDCTIAKVVGGSDLVVCAWGVNGTGERVRRVVELIAAPHCLGLTMHGAPRHPLYVRADTQPIPFALQAESPDGSPSSPVAQEEGPTESVPTNKEKASSCYDESESLQ